MHHRNHLMIIPIRTCWLSNICVQYSHVFVMCTTCVVSEHHMVAKSVGRICEDINDVLRQLGRKASLNTPHASVRQIPKTVTAILSLAAGQSRHDHTHPLCGAETV